MSVAWSEAGLYSCGLEYGGVTSVCDPGSSEGNMWATLHALEHNNLDGMTLIPAPRYGQTLLPIWAAPNMPISNYGGGLAERVTTV